ncbi:hypothetical protein J40TS1_37670 [Paenibacillus montaniterrae]|uniref:GyrI-like small molecule binding domain-containing protein n=1 Tax=Paenibacillus montaniterrae TaxID=429341 RepID=A0A920CZ67_9BACL|nr:GyrI-like domain-containing protein [Paenibacillus montaniterrae]GIP18125.1 hypothetical protein J40TS1_37670 [Paenibacillus montaniterrae]
MEPTIYKFPSMNILGVGSIGTIVSPSDVWPILFSKIEEIPYRKHPVKTLGIIKRNEQGYLAGVEVEQIIDIPEGMYSYEIPAGNYIGMTHRGPLNKININHLDCCSSLYNRLVFYHSFNLHYTRFIHTDSNPIAKCSREI